MNATQRTVVIPPVFISKGIVCLTVLAVDAVMGQLKLKCHVTLTTIGLMDGVVLNNHHAEQQPAAPEAAVHVEAVALAAVVQVAISAPGAVVQAASVVAQADGTLVAGNKHLL